MRELKDKELKKINGGVLKGFLVGLAVETTSQVLTGRSTSENVADGVKGMSGDYYASGLKSL